MECLTILGLFGIIPVSYTHLNSYDQESYKGGTAFFIGNEGKGLTDQAAEAADCLIRIPMCGKVESLNAAMASGILMYEAARQRRE